jgi:hypothetical protein
MTSKSRFKIKRWDTTLLAVFYLVSGIAYFLILALDLSNLITVFLGFLSLVITYGLIKPKNWTMPFVVALFFPQITFEIFALYASMQTHTFVEAIFFNITLVIHMILLTICVLYIAAKRKEFQL